MEELQKGFVGGSESRANNLTRQNDEQKPEGGGGSEICGFFSNISKSSGFESLSAKIQFC